MRKFFKTITDLAGYWQTWVGIVSGAITVWEIFEAHARKLPADEVILRGSAVFALTFAGALFLVKLWEWIEEKHGHAAGVRRARETLQDLLDHRHTEIKLSDLARVWSGSTWNQPGGRQTFDEWRKWNSKLRELKDATNGELIEVASNPDGRVTLRTMLRMDSALKFFASSEWKHFPVRRD